MLKPITACALAALTFATVLPVSSTVAQQAYPAAEEPRAGRTRTRANDAYRPGPDQAGLGVIDGGRQTAPGGSESAPYAGGGQPNFPQPSYSGAPVYNPAPDYSRQPSAPAYSQGYGQGSGQGYGQSGNASPPYQPPYQSQRGDGGYSAPAYGTPTSGANDPYRAPPRGGSASSDDGFGQPYAPPPSAHQDSPQGRIPYRSGQEPSGEYRNGNTYSTDEIKNAGHGFFGSISQGLASVIEHTYRKKGRPNGYILGEEAGGAFVAGLRYGQGRLYTKDAGVHNVYWQGPSLGFDAGAEGSKVMVLVYNIRDVGDIYDRFGGIDGSAYIVGGVGVTFLSKDHVVLAPIRAGVGLRFGANIGYLKYTSKPTWNPF
jgi:hypothetical protein